ncbi:rRNA-processing protein EFG1-like [Chenopodium quinoa]|uniref:rRNA-processing protein EFG1-like n=1 Tax=Chenopodium quinoa TaxID=63459 RepID=UPI000B782124|nr:rRNA-processing protein EFG1-like [Chenopodium quinoa]
MSHGGYGKRRVAERKPSSSHRSKAVGVVAKKPKAASLKNQIRSIERMLRKDLPPEMKAAQEKKLEGLKKQQDLHTRLAVERKVFLRDRKIKFFERRKIERRLRRLEKNLRSSSGQIQEKEIAQLKEDLEYVRFFPKTEKYVSLFTGDDNSDIVDKRNRLRKQIKANIIAAAASGKDLEETGSEDDGLADLSDDDFFVSGTSSDEADADDELTDLSAREQASSASGHSGKAASGLSSDERNQKQKSARCLMPPPRPQKSITRRNITPKNTSNHRNFNSYNRESSNSQTGQSSNMSSNSDAPKPRRKRRPKKKKQ